MMKLLYIANTRFPNERAHGIQIAEMCSAFVDVGVEVELIVQKRVNVVEEDAFIYYHIPRNFQITELRTIDTLQFAWTGVLGKLGYMLQSLVFSLHALIYVLRKRGSYDLVYSRDELPLFFLSLFSCKFAYEIHAAKWNMIVTRVLQKAVVLFPISQGLKTFYQEKGIPDGRMSGAPDAVSSKFLVVMESRDACRTKLSLPFDKKIVLYAGHLYKRKGAFIAGSAAEKLNDDTLAVFVGGTDDEIPDFTKRFGGDTHVRILGPKPHAEIPYYLRAADILVLPNTAKDADARLYTSPMKLFEYMASGTPIIASDVPSIREILDETTAYFVKPDDASALAVCINEVLCEKEVATIKAEKALGKVQQYSWKNRAKKIVIAIEAVTNSQK